VTAPLSLHGLTFVTASDDKIREAEAMLGVPLSRASLDLPEVQGTDVMVVAGEKARLAWEALERRPAMVDDTGLAFHAWSGLPGALVKWFVKSVGVEGLCRMLRDFPDRSASATTVVAVCDGEVHTFLGTVRGKIAEQPRGEYGFGWDSIFIPDGSDRTFAEMLPAEKTRYSMRALALGSMVKAMRIPPG
jgi:non-canonical purine NTP pyrophosphatase (RdgB/HAM1 family)